MAEIRIISNIEIDGQGGGVLSGKQGDAEDADTDPVILDGDGDGFVVAGTLATATAVKIYDDDTHTPTSFLAMHLWTSVDMYVQVIGATSNVIFPVEAEVPFMLSSSLMLAAANTTPLSGSAPSTEDIDSIVIQNNSGGSGKYRAVFGN